MGTSTPEAVRGPPGRARGPYPTSKISLLARSALIAVLFGLIAAGTLTALGKAVMLRLVWPPEVDALYLPRSGLIRLMSLGHSDAAADLVAVRANVYFGTQFVYRGHHRWLERYLNTVVDLDPWFRKIYQRGATMLVYTGKKFSVAQFEASNRLLDRGIERFPSNWDLHFQRGFNLYYELPQLVSGDDRRAAEWRQKGVESLRQAALLEGAPSWLPNLVARALTKQGSVELAIHSLEHAFAVTSNAEAREQIRLKLIELRGQHLADELERGSAELKRVIETRYPYAPEAFSLVAGPRDQPRVDLDAAGAGGIRP